MTTIDTQTPDERDGIILTIAEAVLMLRKITCEPGGHARRWSEQHP